MLIIDDRLTAHVLRGNYAWLPAGHDPADLATTTDRHYRLLTAVLKPAPTGVHSTGFHELPEAVAVSTFSSC